MEHPEEGLLPSVIRLASFRSGTHLKSRVIYQKNRLESTARRRAGCVGVRGLLLFGYYGKSECNQYHQRNPRGCYRLRQLFIGIRILTTDHSTDGGFSVPSLMGFHLNRISAKHSVACSVRALGNDDPSIHCTLPTDPQVLLNYFCIILFSC